MVEAHEGPAVVLVGKVRIHVPAGVSILVTREPGGAAVVRIGLRVEDPDGGGSAPDA